MTRKLYEIAEEVVATWPKVNYAAKPYLSAMGCLASVDSMYGCDTGDSIVRYFLSNAATWRGPDARRIKAELKSML